MNALQIPVPERDERLAVPFPSLVSPPSRVLDSVGIITHQRDLDGLNDCLVASLAELVPTRTISLCRLISSDPAVLEEVARWPRELGASDIAVHKGKVADLGLIACLESLRPRLERSPNGSNRLLIPVHGDGKAIGALVIESDHDLSAATPVVEGVARIYSNFLMLLNESERDKLTGLYNRRTFERKLERMLETQRRNRELVIARDGAQERRHCNAQSHAWLAILDIDHFKRINDGFGHVYGDEVILMLSHKMRESFRRSDLLFRFGGEEFVVLLEPAVEEMARVALERFRERVEAHPFPQVGRVTVSIGYARIAEHDNPALVLDLADKALYYAKQNGRNCIHGYEALVAEGKLASGSRTGSVDLF